jgi:hypothetical protein
MDFEMIITCVKQTKFFSNKLNLNRSGYALFLPLNRSGGLEELA